MKTLLARIADKVLVGDGCWDWTGAKNEAGYGRINTGTATLRAHRVLYVMFNGDVPVGLELDHLCRNKSCVRPDHLEAVTRGVNIRRGTAPLSLPKAVRRAAEIKRSATECRRGHTFDETNTAWVRGRRRCRACAALATRRWRAEPRR